MTWDKVVGFKMDSSLAISGFKPDKKQFTNEIGVRPITLLDKSSKSC